jgi:hypothetical protein
VRETVEWLRVKRAISVPNNVREIVELTTHADHLEDRAVALGQRWVELWQRLYGHAMAAGQQALSGLVDRSQGYHQALVNERVPTRLGDGLSRLRGPEPQHHRAHGGLGALPSQAPCRRLRREA